MLNKDFLYHNCDRLEHLTASYSVSLDEEEKEKIAYTIHSLVEYMFVSLSRTMFDTDEKLKKYEAFKAQNAAYDSIYNIEKAEYSFTKFLDGYRVILPPLLNRRSGKYKSFTLKSNYVLYVFERLLEKNKDIITRLDNATIFIIMHYPTGNVIRDNDNSDGHHVINFIRKHLLNCDDNGIDVSLFYSSEVSETSYCELLILPQISVKEMLKTAYKNYG